MKTKKTKPKPRSRRVADPSPWRPSERLIYRYWDGSREVAADPLVVQRELLNVDGVDLEIDWKLAMGTSRDAPNAVGRLVVAVRHAFKVPAFDPDAGTGLTESECLALLVDFSAYLDTLKKKHATSLGSPEPTGSTQGGGSLTPSSSDST